MKMKTLERRAKTNELQRLRKAQVSESGCIHNLLSPDFSTFTEYSYTLGHEFKLLKFIKMTSCWVTDEFIVERCLTYLIWVDVETSCGGRW